MIVRACHAGMGKGVLMDLMKSDVAGTFLATTSKSAAVCCRCAAVHAIIRKMHAANSRKYRKGA